MKSTTTLFLCFLLVVATVWSKEPSPLGDEFQVNTYTPNDQDYPVVATDSAGNFVVVWSSFGSDSTDTSQLSIQLRRFTSDGTPVNNESQVNTFTTASQNLPSIAATSDGDFVVVWASYGSYGTDASSFSIQGQRFASDGTPLGSQFQVNSYTTDFQTGPDVALADSGDFVVVWQSDGSYGNDTSSTSIQGQRYDQDGNTVGSEFQVNTYTTSIQIGPSVAADGGGEFVVVWTSIGSDGTDSDGFSIQGQGFASDGTPLGSQFQVNTFTTSNQRYPAAGQGGTGDFVVAWQSYGQDGDGSGVFGQRIDSSGTLQGSEFQANTYTTGGTGYGAPGVAVGADGRFVVAWRANGSYGTDTSSYSVQGQLFDADSRHFGGQFQVDSYTKSDQGYRRTEVATAADGLFVVVWDSDGSSGTDASGTSIQAQRFSASLIFSDGFEAGDTSAWSNSVP